MKHIKLFESFEGFPNTKEEIDRVCKKYGIMDYTINEDMSIDVVGNFYLFSKSLYKLPLKFNKVDGSFYCNDNQLTTLEGAPKIVGGDFYCNNNKLTTLKGASEKVNGNFHCGNNELTSLEGAPEYVGGDFFCYRNQLTTLEGAPNTVGDYFSCPNNPIYSLYVLFNYNYKWLKNSIEEYSWLYGTEIIKHRLIDVFLDLDLPEPNLSRINKVYTLI
jgi:hypothetical protein